jgi:hypothetical protein
VNRATALSLAVLFVPLVLPAQTFSKPDMPAARTADGAPVLKEKQNFMGTPPTASSIESEDSRVFRMSGFKPKGYLSQLVGCPINLQAQSMGEVKIVIVDGTQRYAVPSPRIHLMFTNRQAQGIVAMSVTIHGYDATPRMMPAGFGSTDSPAIKKIVDLTLDVASGKNAETDVLLRSFASISRVDLESVEYADGTSWKASELQSCKIVPNRLMLISSR